MWFLFALLSGLGSAIFALIIKLYLKNINTFFMSFTLFFIASLILLSLGIFTNKINFDLISHLDSKVLLALIAAGVINAGAFTLYLTALSWGNVCTVVAVDRLGILYVVILSMFILKQALSFKSVIGSVLMILGAFLLA